MKENRTQILMNLLAEVNGASFISIDTITTPILNKTIVGSKPRVDNPHYGMIKKHQTGSVVMAFQNKNVNGYEAMIRRRLIEEGKDPATFVLGERRWGTRIPNMPVVQHNDSYYLEVIFLRPGEVTYTLNGRPINVSEIIGLREASKPEQGGLSNTVIIRTIEFDSIKRIKIGGMEFTLR